jgi:hypothetical protein
VGSADCTVRPTAASLFGVAGVAVAMARLARWAPAGLLAARAAVWSPAIGESGVCETGAAAERRERVGEDLVGADLVAEDGAGAWLTASETAEEPVSVPSAVATATVGPARDSPSANAAAPIRAPFLATHIS